MWTKEDLPWCDVELNLGSKCLQRTAIDLVNLLFLSFFYLLLVAGCVSQRFTLGSRKKGWIFVAAAICCAATSIIYLGAGLKNLIASANDEVSWVACFVEGLIWVSLTVSLLVNVSKWIKILASVWWVSFALLDSAAKIEILSQGKSIRMFDIITWLISLLLLLCSWMNLRSSPEAQDYSTAGLSDPLLAENSKKNSARLATARFFSFLSFSWMNSLLSLGFKKPLTPDDIPSVVPEDEAELAYTKFSKAWDDALLSEPEGAKERNLVFRAVAKVYFKENILTAVCALFRTIAVVSLPLMLYVFVDYANSDHRDLRTGFFNLACLVMLKLVESLSMRHWYFAARRSGMRIRSALMVAAYKKQLKLSSLGRKRHSSGEIVNYIAVDAYRMGEFLWWFHSGWSLTLQLLLSTAVLFGVVGIGAVPGLILLLLCGLLNLPFAKMLQNCQTQFMIAQDKRLRSTSEILNSMKVIKLQSWEEEFKKQIESCRDEEFKWLAKAQLTKAFGTFLYWMSPTIVSSVIFVGCALMNSAPLNASTIFTVLATLRVMSEPVRVIPEAISAIIQVNVSFDRINNFLLDDELKTDEIERSLSFTSGFYHSLSPNKEEKMSSQICRSASKAARSLLSSAKNARFFSEGRAIGAAAAVTASGKMPLYASNFARSSGSSKSWITGLLALPAAAFMVQDQEVFAAEMERTFIAIKPDGVQRGLISEIISRFERKGFKLVGIKVVVPSKDFAQKHYHDLKERPFFNGLCDFLSSGPVIAMVWEGEGVIRYGRKLIGATDPQKSEPGTIRGDLAVVVGRNIIHGSDGPETAKDEINLWFKPQELVSYTNNAEKWIYGDN